MAMDYVIANVTCALRLSDDKASEIAPSPPGPDP